jgi:hypothetical protein
MIFEAAGDNAVCVWYGLISKDLGTRPDLVYLGSAKTVTEKYGHALLIIVQIIGKNFSIVHTLVNQIKFELRDQSLSRSHESSLTIISGT